MIGTQEHLPSRATRTVQLPQPQTATQGTGVLACIDRPIMDGCWQLSLHVLACLSILGLVGALMACVSLMKPKVPPGQLRRA